MLRVPGRRVDRLLHVHAAMHVAQKKLRGPLILLVAAGRSPDEIRLAVAQRERGRKSSAWTLAGRQRIGMAFFEPELLRARSQTEPKLGNDRRGLQPAT